ncbi:hypothetical protein Hypma_014610 [Hypsizygus marmoreus]|uniref:Uncharacterized protein n=1 Tax=Hypsizygus marmoreus TaxID=39966 RepID=A0A369JIW5_HYPMA|nr:hypothetical protein Hypma_014610 [Hypsizygus marmoreus]
MEEYRFQDPVIDFLEKLYVDFAQRKLGVVGSVVGDSFFGEFREETLGNARYFVSEKYFQIYQRIDVGELLDLSREIRARIGFSTSSRDQDTCMDVHAMV